MLFLKVRLGLMKCGFAFRPPSIQEVGSSGPNQMKNTIAVLWYGILILAVTQAYAWEAVDGWPMVDGNLHVKVGSWISATQISVLDGQTQNTASLNRNQNSQSVPTVVKPKPRPRLGGGEKAANTEVFDKTYEGRILKVSGFLANVVGLFSEQWNAPRLVSEATQWVHEIEVECVFSVDKQNGMIAIESLSNSPDTAELAYLRQGVSMYNEADAIYGKPYTTTNAEMNRFKDFIRSLAPLKLPECLVNLPGNPLRIRLSVKIVKISSTAGVLTAPPPAAAPDTNNGQVATAAANIGSSGSSSTYVHNPGEFTRPIPPEELRKHLDDGDPIFQYALGFRYLEGDGLRMDYVMALHWFTKAAEQGYAPAQCQLGFMYAVNYGAPRDAEKALYWYEKAADQNYIRAIFNIGTMYQNGNGVKRDLAEAAKWSRKGAELGDSGCQADLAWRYAIGEGVTKDPAEAFNWYMKAALQGHTFAQFTVGMLYEQGQGIPKDEIEALAWYNLSPTNGLDEKINHRDRLERTLGPKGAAEARNRAEKLRQKITQK